MRGVRSSSLHKKPWQLSSTFNFIYWWLIMSHLNELLQVTTRSLAASSSLIFFSTDERCCSFFKPPQKSLTAVKHFWILWLMTYDVSFEWSGTSYNQVLSCSQFGDFLLDGWEVFILHPSTKKPRQLSSTFEFYLLMTDHVSFGWGGTGCCQVFSCKQFSVFFSTDEQGLPSCKSNSQVLHVNATVLSLPVQVLVHPNAKAAAWWHRPQSVGRCL